MPHADRVGDVQAVDHSDSLRAAVALAVWCRVTSVQERARGEDKEMATERYFNCPKCRRRIPSLELLFDVLLEFPKSVPDCSCGESCELLLIPPFALGAGGMCFKVLDAFHESVSWMNDKKRVTFYPFLIVLEGRGDGKRKFWLPYWHVEGSRRKFGERAPWMDADLFADLLCKAHARGYLVG